MEGTRTGSAAMIKVPVRWKAHFQLMDAGHEKRGGGVDNNGGGVNVGPRVASHEKEGEKGIGVVRGLFQYLKI